LLQRRLHIRHVLAHRGHLGPARRVGAALELQGRLQRLHLLAHGPHLPALLRPPPGVVIAPAPEGLAVAGQGAREPALRGGERRGGARLDRVHDLAELGVPALLPPLHPLLEEPRRGLGGHRRGSAAGGANRTLAGRAVRRACHAIDAFQVPAARAVAAADQA
jgi:hypothetical protein